MIFFNIAINPVMVAVSMVGVSPFLFKVPMQVLAYTDGIAPIANNEEDSQVIIEKTNEVTEFCVMSFNTDKCACMNTPQDKSPKSEILIKKLPD